MFNLTLKEQRILDLLPIRTNRQSLEIKLEKQKQIKKKQNKN